MGYQEPIAPIELKGWFKGLNREADAYQLEETEVPDALNVDFGLRGAVSKRRGYISHATDTENSLAIIEFSGEIILVKDDGDIFYLSGTTVTTAANSLGAHASAREYSVGTAALNNFVYLTRARSTTPVRWNGSAWSTVTATNFDGTASRFPRAKVLVGAHERIFAFNVISSGGTSWPSRMHYSNALAAETWDANDWIDFAPDDGTDIQAAVLFGEQIVVFKDKSMFALAGTDESTFTVYPIDASLGCQAPLSIVNVGPQLFFFDHLTGVWSFDGSGFKRIDDKINTYLLDGINEGVVYKSVGFAFRGRYFLSVPWGADTVNSRTFVYDPRIDSWTEYDFGFADAVLQGSTPLAVTVRGSTGVKELFVGNDDAGANIEAYFKTGWLAPTSPSVKHRIRRLDLTLSALGDYDVEVNMRRDFELDAYKSQSLNTDSGGAVYGTAVYGTDSYGLGLDQILSRTTGWGDRWRVCQFEFREDTQGDFQVNRMTMQTSSLRRTRGAH